MGADSTETAGVVAPPPLLFLGPLLVGLVVQRVRPAPLLPRGWAPTALGVGLLSTGGALLGWSLATLGAARTPVEPWEPTTAIARSGPYRYTRNPIYLAMLLSYLGVTAWRNALWPVLLLPGALVVVQRGVVDREERYLERRFGEEYRAYKADVRRWL